MAKKEIIICVLLSILFVGCQPNQIIKYCYEQNYPEQLTIVAENCKVENCIMVNSIGYPFYDEARGNYFQCIAMNLEAEKIHNMFNCTN